MFYFVNFFFPIEHVVNYQKIDFDFENIIIDSHFDLKFTILDPL
jgi:hypothetical protein